MKPGVYCEIYGNMIDNRIMEFLLENQDLDFGVGDMAKELKISKPKAYETIFLFEKKGYVKKSRVIGRTQLYTLNKDNLVVVIFLRNFKECINLELNKHKKGARAINGRDVWKTEALS